MLQKPRRPVSEADDISQLTRRIKELVGEIERLKRDQAAAGQALKRAEARVRDLESQRDQALNHIDWAIDSLHTILDAPN